MELKIIFLGAQIAGSAYCQHMSEKIIQEFNARTEPIMCPIPNVPAGEIIHWVVADRALEQVYAPSCRASSLTSYIGTMHGFTST